MSDMISRQDAIRLAEQGQIQGFEWQFKKLCELPSAQPERKKGKWLRSGNCIFPYECDQCGDTNERATPFCPNCGAEMRGEQDEKD